MRKRKKLATWLAENSKMSADIIELKSAVARSNNEVNKLKEDMNNQAKYVASLEEEVARVSKKVKTTKEELEDLQVSFDELEQYTRKNSLELHCSPENIDLPMDEMVCKVAEAIGIELECDDVEIAHRPGPTGLIEGKESNQ